MSSSSINSTADDFATFFINKITNLTAQFSTPQSIKHILPANKLVHILLSTLWGRSLYTHPFQSSYNLFAWSYSSHLLQAISPAVVPALTHIVNTSLHTGIVPSVFKQKPTLNPTLLGNYRPVSLLPFIAKTLERVVFNQVTAFLTQNNLLDSNQSGFRSGHSTETALLSVVEDLRLARSASKSSLLILLDLSAAFDTVKHQILLSTLLRKGISGTAVQWFDSYLSDRSFKVSWRGIQVTTSSYRGATGLSSWTTSLFCLHGFTRFGHSETWLFRSRLCWCHSTLPLIPSWWSDDSCSACLADISCWMKDHHLQLNLHLFKKINKNIWPSINCIFIL